MTTLPAPPRTFRDAYILTRRSTRAPRRRRDDVGQVFQLARAGSNFEGIAPAIAEQVSEIAPFALPSAGSPPTPPQNEDRLELRD